MHLKELVGLRKNYLKALDANKFDFRQILVGLYVDKFHFLHELIQNAEDAGATWLHMDLEADCLLVRHNGEKKFTVADVDAITGISNLHNEKKQAEGGAIGRFGIGFKSVFKITDRPRIRCGQFDFSIERFILPIVHSETAEFADTLLELPFRAGDEELTDLATQLQARFAVFEPHNLLFLNNLTELRFRWAPGQERCLRKEQQPAESGQKALVAEVAITEEASTTEAKSTFYLLFRAEAEHADLQHLAQKPRLMLAFRREADKQHRLVPAESSQVFVFFRTNHESYLKFLVHAPFDTTPSRGDFEQNHLNKLLLGESVGLFRRVLKYFLGKNLLTIGLLKLLPIEPVKAAGNPWFYQEFFEATREELRSNKAYLPTHQPNQFAAASQVLLAYSGELTGLLHLPEQMEPLFPSRTHWLPNELTYTRQPVLYTYLKTQLQVPEVRVEEFIKRLIDTVGYLPAASIEWLGRFYAFLRGHRSLWAPGTATVPAGALRQYAIIRLANGSAEYAAPFDATDQPQVFLPAADGSTSWPDRCVEPALLAIAGAREFLEQDLGLREPDNVDEIERQMLPLYALEPAPEPDLHRQHMAVLVQTSQNKAQAKKLIELLGSKKTRPEFIWTTPKQEGEAPAYVDCGQAYLPNADLARFLEPTATVRYVDKSFYAQVEGSWQELLEKCGVRTAFPWVRTAEAKLNETERQQLRAAAYQDEGACTAELKLKDWCMDGLAEFLTQPAGLTAESSQLLWRILTGFAGSAGSAALQKALTGEYHWKVEAETRRTSFSSQIRTLLETTPWLPGLSGTDNNRRWQTVPETVFSELPAEYDQTSAGARCLKEVLRWKSSPEDGLPQQTQRQLEQIRKLERMGFNLDEMLREAVLAQQEKLKREAQASQAPTVREQTIVLRPFNPPIDETLTPITVVSEPVITVSARAGKAGNTIAKQRIEPLPDSPEQEHLDWIGRQGEKLVWQVLQAEWTGKPGFILNNQMAFYLYYHDQHGTNYEVEWGNDETKTSVGYDFRVQRQMVGEPGFQPIEYHEVKASEDPGKTWFEVSEAQWQLARRQGSAFTLWLVQGVFSAKPLVTRISNPVGEWQAGRLRAYPVRVELEAHFQRQQQ